MDLFYMSDEVAYIKKEIRILSIEHLEILRGKAISNHSGKMRICMHPAAEHSLHEMFIALRRDVHYPPHRNKKTEETHFILSGLATLYIYHDSGELLQAIPMGPFDSGRISYARIPAGIFHCFVIESDVCIYYETKLGPFDPADSENATFIGPKLL